MKYLNGPAGSGKTKYMLDDVFSNFRRRKHLIVQPTLKLQNETFTALKPIEQYCRLLNSDTTSELLQGIKAAIHDSETRVILITEKMFYKIDPVLTKDLCIWMDDCTELFNKRLTCIRAEDFEAITELYSKYVFKTSSSYNEKYQNVEVKNVDANNSTDINSIITEVSNAVCGFNRVVTYVQPLIGEQSHTYLNLIAWHDLAVFKDHDITFMANSFESTLLFKQHAAMFTAVDHTGRGDIDRTRLQVKYFVKSEHLPYGLTKAFSQTTEGMAVTSEIVKYINQESTELFYTQNIETESVIKGEKCSPVLRGMNSMQHLKACAWLSCMNPSVQEIQVLKDVFGFTNEDLKRNREYETLYQFVCRGIIRDRSSTEHMIVYVVSEDQALFLVDNPQHVELNVYLPEAKRPGRKSTELSTDQVKAFKAFKRQIKNSTNKLSIDEFIQTQHYSNRFRSEVKEKLLKFISK